MDEVWYSDSRQGVKRGGKETRPPARQSVEGWLGAILLFSLLALFWWQGRLDPDLLLGLLVFGAISGGDRGPGSDEPPRRKGIDWLDILLSALGGLSLRRLSPGEGFARRTPLPDLPPIDFQPIPSAPPVLSREQRDREKLIKAMEKSIAEEFRKSVSEVQAVGSDVDIRKLLGRRPPIPTLRFDRQAPPRPAARPRAMQEAYTETLLRDLRNPWPVQSASGGFSDAERKYDSPPDFRTEGERRRDARQEAVRLEPPRRQPSPMDKLLASALKGKKERRVKAPSSRKRKADEVWAETTAQARKLNALKKRIEAGEAHPAEEVFAVAALPDSLAELSPKLQQARAEAREKVLEMFEKGNIPEVVPLGEGASFEQKPIDLETVFPSDEALAEAGGIPEAVQTYFDLYKTDEFVAEAVIEANRILQAPGNTASFEGGKYVIRDVNGNLLVEGTVVLSSAFYTRNSADEYSVINPPIAAGVGFELKINPPPNEKLTVYRGLGRHQSIGAIYGSDSDGQQSVGFSINIGFSLPLGIPFVVSTPVGPKEILKALPEEFTPGA